VRGHWRDTFLNGGGGDADSCLIFWNRVSKYSSSIYCSTWRVGLLKGITQLLMSAARLFYLTLALVTWPQFGRICRYCLSALFCSVYFLVCITCYSMSITDFTFTQNLTSAREIPGLPKCVLCKCRAYCYFLYCWQFDSWFCETCSLWAFPFSSTDNIDLVHLFYCDKNTIPNENKFNAY